jgi:uncharacterized protein YjbJ (UPF0337 family)
MSAQDKAKNTTQLVTGTAREHLGKALGGEPPRK